MFPYNQISEMLGNKTKRDFPNPGTFLKVGILINVYNNSFLRVFFTVPTINYVQLSGK